METPPPPAPEPGSPPPLRPTPPSTPPPLPILPTSRAAVASLVFGIGAVLTCGITALPGLICGIVALVRLNRRPRQFRGEGLAITGLVLSGVCLMTLPILAGMLLPALSQAKSRAQTIQSVNNLKQLGLAAHLYATDHDGKFPDARNWCDALKPYIGGAAESVFRRPADKSTGPCSYGYNEFLSGLNSADIPPEIVLFFELQQAGWNLAGGSDLIRRPANNRDQVAIGYADGSVMQIRGNGLKGLQWEPIK